MNARTLWLGALLVASLMAPAAAAEPKWHTDYEKALAEAKKQDKVVLADFTGSDWCGWCIKLKKEVFDTPEFKTWADENVVLLELDFPNSKPQPAELKKQNKELQKKFSIRGYPTIVFISAEGKELGRTGYKKGGPKVWTDHADQLLTQAKRAPKPAEGAAAEGHGDWLVSYEEAVAKAKQENKLILADFTGSDWCGWCIKLKKEVFHTAEFKEWAKANVVLLELDFPKSKPQPEEIKQQNQALLKKHGVRGFPTILFLTPEGASAGKLGYLPGGPTAWIAKAQEIVSQRSK